MPSLRLLRRASLLTVARVVNWCSLCFIVWPPIVSSGYVLLASILASVVFTWLVLRTEKDRKSRCPPFIVALSQIGGFFEVLAGRVIPPPAPTEPGIELASPEDPAHLVEGGNLPSFQVSSSVLLADHQAGGAAVATTAMFELHLHILRKMMVAQLPEAVVSTIVHFRLATIAIEEAFWRTGLARNTTHTLMDIGEDNFNRLFQESPTGIIRRICPRGCESSHERIFYRRHSHWRPFEPYHYMKDDWQIGPENAFHVDFDLFSSYEDAKKALPKDAWKWCSSPKPDDPVGFPGDCNTEEHPAEGQWSSFPTNSHDFQQGRAAIFQVEREVNFTTLMESVPLSTVSLFTIPSCRVPVEGLESPLIMQASGCLVPLWLDLVLLNMCLVIAMMALAVGVADVVICMWVQTEFVRENTWLVSVFYMLEVCSGWPLLMLVVSYPQLLTGLFVHLGAIVLLLLAGLSSTRMRRTSSPHAAICKEALRKIGQTLVACLLAPAMLLVNFCFFDQSSTFKHLNRWYYILRLAQLLNVAFCLSDPRLSVLFIFASVTSIPLAFLVWVFVPRARRMARQKSAKRFAEQVAEAPKGLTASLLEDADAMLATQIGRHGLRSSSHRSSSVHHGIVVVLNAIGDTFEALLLASSADSWNVRSAVLGVAMKPVIEASKFATPEWLPLIMPQILLSLRWRTVNPGLDESCELTCFIISRVLASKDIGLVSDVYWNLLALSTDSNDSARLTYREVRLSLLDALEEHAFADLTFDPDLCTQALRHLANQRRIYYQLRSLARVAGTIKGSHKEKTRWLQRALSRSQTFRRWEKQPVMQPDFQGRRPDRTQTVADVRRFVSEDVTPRRCCLHRRCRMVLEGCQSCVRSCGRVCFGRGAPTAADPVRDEWALDSVLTEFEDTEVNLASVAGKDCSLPVDPLRRIGKVRASQSFIAHSAVAPLVVCCELRRDAVPSLVAVDEKDEEDGAQGEEPSQLQLYALKMGDDLRQDALVLQVFRLMEVAWAEHGLTDLALRPYNVIPVSPQEGMVAFVPKAVKLSTILQQHDGDVSEFIQRHCDSPRDGFDKLCGSTAGYCVATYLLGIGDRHLDNLMITEDGHFFHIDFGFVLGDDPKPLSPTVRVPREILDALRSQGRYEKFRFLLGEAFLLIRKTARLWTSLLSLTARAGGNGSGALGANADRALSLLRERMRLDLDEAAARCEIVAEIEESAHSMVPLVYDKLHQTGLFWN